MFTNISWSNYIIFIVILLTCWYLIIGLKFYLSDLQIFLSAKRKSNDRVDGNGITSIPGVEEIDFGHDSEMVQRKQIERLFEQVEFLSAKIKHSVADASSKNYNKEEFAFLLQLTLKEYSEVKGSSFQVPINNLIVSECEKIGFIHLSREELAMLWKEV